MREIKNKSPLNGQCSITLNSLPWECTDVCVCVCVCVCACDLQSLSSTPRARYIVFFPTTLDLRTVILIDFTSFICWFTSRLRYEASFCWYCFLSSAVTPCFVRLVNLREWVEMWGKRLFERYWSQGKEEQQDDEKGAHRERQRPHEKGHLSLRFRCT